VNHCAKYEMIMCGTITCALLCDEPVVKNAKLLPATPHWMATHKLVALGDRDQTLNGISLSYSSDHIFHISYIRNLKAYRES